MTSEQLDGDRTGPSVESEEFLRHLAPIVEALGGRVVHVEDPDTVDVPIVWQGQTVGFVRRSELHGALDRLVDDVEREAGRNLGDMSRSEKQTAVRRLDEVGAFLLRGAVEDIAQLMGVSRVTLYSYINAIRPDDEAT